MLKKDLEIELERVKGELYNANVRKREALKEVDRIKIELNDAQEAIKRVSTCINAYIQVFGVPSSHWEIWHNNRNNPDEEMEKPVLTDTGKILDHLKQVIHVPARLR